MLKKIILGSIILFVILLFATFALLNHFFSLESFSDFETLLSRSGIWGPFLIIMLQAVQVILVPIPGHLTGIISGYFFGSFWGTLYSMIGLSIGSFAAFYLSRNLGTPFVEKIVSQKTLDRFLHISDHQKISVIFLFFLLPMFPDDAICFIAGLTKIKIRNLMIAAVVGRLPGCLVANAIGNGIALSTVQTTVLFAFCVFVFLLFMYLSREKIEKRLYQHLNTPTK